MATESVKIYSGADRGSGQLKTWDGWIRRYRESGGFVWLTEVYNWHTELRVGRDDVMDGGDRFNRWRSYLSFDMTGIDVSKIIAARLGLYLEYVNLADPPLWESPLGIRYGYDKWNAPLAGEQWASASTEWPGVGGSGAWQPGWVQWSGGDTGEYKIHTAPDLSPLTGFSGTLLQVSLRLASGTAGMGQYTVLAAGEDKAAPYLELDFLQEPGQEVIPGHAHNGNARALAPTAAAPGHAAQGAVNASASNGAIGAYHDSGAVRGK